MTIPAYRLPAGIEKGSQWDKCRGVGDISYGLLNSTNPTGDFRAIIAIYRAHYSSLLPFRFKDWSDYQCTDENFGTGDGAETEFQLTKTYDPSYILGFGAGALVYVRDIVLLATAPVIKVDGVTKTVTTDYTISNGLVTFTSPPANAKPLTWTGEFDVPVRFDGPLSVIMNEGDNVAIGSLPIKEVIGET